jgi:anti-sigma regulatory factor (Ser/Thr protein kinase)
MGMRLTVATSRAARICLPSTRRSAAEGRAFVAATLQSWGHRRGLGDVLLVVSELVTNAVLHAGGAGVDLTVTLTDHAVRIEVTDASSALPEPKPPTDDSTNGRGLLLVDAVAGTWGAEVGHSGKRVWAEVR